MLKKRTLLLGAAVAAFGAILAGGAFAAQSSSIPSGPSDSINITVATFGTVDITGEPAFVPATGVPTFAGNIVATDTDGNYGYSISAPTLDSPGAFSGLGCAGVNSYALNGATLPVASTTANAGPHTIGSTLITFAIANNTPCTHSGAVVSAVFTVVGGN